MIKYIISEEEKRRILNLHEGFKKGLLSEQVSGATSGTTKPEINGVKREPKSQAFLDWMGTGSTLTTIKTGPVIGKVYSTTIMNWYGIQEPVTFDMKVQLAKDAKYDGSWLGYAMWIYDVKSGELIELLDIDCKTVSTYINSLKSKEWSQLKSEGQSQYKWFFNIQFLNDLYQTLGCK